MPKNKQPHNIPNKKLKCWMLTAKNGGRYRACATPSKMKGPKRERRGNPLPASKRIKPYVTAYGGRPYGGRRNVKGEDDKRKVLPNRTRTTATTATPSTPRPKPPRPPRPKKPLTVTRSDGTKSEIKMRKRVPKKTVLKVPKTKPVPKKAVVKKAVVKKPVAKKAVVKKAVAKPKPVAKPKAVAKPKPAAKKPIPDCFTAHKDDVIIINKKNNRKYVVCKELNAGRVRIIEITGLKNNSINKFGNYEGEPTFWSLSSLKSVLKFDDKTIKKIVDYTGLKKEKFKQLEIKREKNKLTELGEKIKTIFKSVSKSKNDDEDNEKKIKKLKDKLDYETRKKLMKTYNKQGLSDNDVFIFDLMKGDEYLREIFLTKMKGMIGKGKNL